MMTRDEMLAMYAVSDAVIAAAFRKDYAESGHRTFRLMQRSRERSIIRAAKIIEANRATALEGVGK
jgi:DICT domain-containing protein